MKRYLLLVGCICSLFACDIINPEESTPAILIVDSLQLLSQPGQGSNSANFTDLWVSIDGQFLGSFPLPARVPILETGSRILKFEAGIRDNGIAATPEIYPFYEILEQPMELTAGETQSISLTIQYLPGALFPMIEDFEQGSRWFTETVIGTELQTTDLDVFEGQQAGRINLTESVSIVEVATNRRFSNLQARSPFVYLELNYKAEVPAVFGIIGYETLGGINGTTIFEPGFFPTASWKKIYFNLSGVLAANNFAEYQLVMRAFIPIEEGELTQKSASVWLDNIKLVHF